MKSVHPHGTGDLRIYEAPKQKLIRARAVGVCGSDLHWFSEGEIGDAEERRGEPDHKNKNDSDKGKGISHARRYIVSKSP